MNLRFYVLGLLFAFSSGVSAQTRATLDKLYQAQATISEAIILLESRSSNGPVQAKSNPVMVRDYACSPVYERLKDEDGYAMQSAVSTAKSRLQKKCTNRISQNRCNNVELGFEFTPGNYSFEKGACVITAIGTD